MNAFLKNIFQKNIYIAVAVIVLCIAAWGTNIYLGSNASAKSFSNSIQTFLQQREKDFNQFLRDTSLIYQLSDQQYSQQQLDELVEKKYAIFIYQKDNNYKLKFWNDQRSSLPPDSLLQKNQNNYFCTLANGQYEVMTAIVPKDKSALLIVALIPIHWQYFIANSNLQPGFENFPDAESKVRIASHITEFPVKNISGTTLFYLEKKAAYNIVRDNWVSQLLIVAVFFLVLLILHNLANAITDRFGAAKGIIFLISVVFLLRMIIYLNPSLLNLRQYELFDPKIYGSNFVLRSLGDLLINSLLFCWIVFFVKRAIGAYAFPSPQTVWVNWLQTVIILFALVVATFGFANIVQSLVTDARIAFSVTNFFSLTVYSFIGFIVLAALALSYFFLSQIFLQLISNLIKKNNLIANIIIAVIGLLLLTFGKNSDIIQLDIFVLIWLLIYMLLLQRQILSGLNLRLNVSEVLFWLFLFSVSISMVIIFENHKIDLEQRKRFAERLSEEADPSNEKVLSIALKYIDNNFLSDNFKRFSSNPSTNSYLKDSIINNSYNAYRHNYDTKIYTYDTVEKSLFNDSPVSYDTLNTIFNIQGKDLNVQGTDTNITGLRYYAKSFDKLMYIYKKTVINTKKKIIGYFFIISEPKNYKDDALLVPELFQPQKEFLPQYAQVYSYAIYNDYKLIYYYNNYQFPTQLSENDIPKTDFLQRRYGSYDELWHLISDNKIVIIVKKDNSILEAITLFAYLFSAFLFLLSIFRMASVLIRTRLQWSRIKSYVQLNIRSQIHTTIIFVSLFSFIVIGVATILFFISRYNRNNQEQLSRSKQIMLGEIQSKLGERLTFNDTTQIYNYGTKESLKKLIENISTIHSTDVNLYDVDGNLVVSSNPFVYNKGILNEKMNPTAYYNIHNLNSIEFFNSEEMGKISYLSIYGPLRDENGEAYAYLNIPSFRTEDDLKDEISKFLVTIINLNAFIFLVAGTIALFLTNKITSSFTLISEKMRDINLGKTNEEIEWKRNDEIGELVKEYNKMVRKLEESAAVLAKSERESAWREMARQVAHEIKNPLTPMKLSIQYLQKAVDNNSVNIKELTAGVANTLVEQIDHLSKIAADFSQFANIGNPKNEIFDLHDILYPLTALYETTENLLFKWVPIHEKIIVNADKTQLNRLFTNLLQNAVEACHKEKRIISISEELNSDSVIIKVTDNGEGIPLATQSKIFIPNFTTKSSGTGLGLAMSKTIVEQAKGKIWFTTEVGEGTTFYVEFPIVRDVS